MSVEIRKLDTLLAEHLETNESIKRTNYTRLTEIGDNYGSIMLKLDVTILNEKTKQERILNLVAKILPDTELSRKIFNVQITYSNEMSFYNTVVPTLQKFQKDIGVEIIDLFPKCYGTRKNLLENDSDIIDDDAVLLMENLKIQGYTNVNRKLGFNLQVTKLLLRDLAQFHSGFLSMKLQRPDLFNKNVLPYCHEYRAHPEMDIHKIYEDIFEEVCRENSDCVPLISKCEPWGSRLRCKPREPLSTVIHTDLWVNNMMQLFKNDVPLKNKFVDFQVFNYGSPAADVFFLLWTSAQKDVLINNLDSLLQYYHNELIQSLRTHKCNVEFSYEQFLKELELEAVYEFAHALLFFMIISIDIAPNTERHPNDCKEIAEKLPLVFKEKLWFMLTECNKRRWIPENS